METMDPILNLLKQRPRDNWDWAFNPAAERDDALNAVALCNAAILTYSTQEDTKQYLSKWRFEEPKILRGFSTQAFVARRENVIVVAFRGTEPINSNDWLSDVNYHQVTLAGVPGSVHGGFAKALDEVLPSMLDSVNDLADGDGARLYVTGHSLGGALAILAAAQLHFRVQRKVAGVYTYGQPRAGDPVFSAAYDAALGAATIRYVNDFDVVPHVPPVRLPAKPHALRAPEVFDFFRKFQDIPRNIQAAVEAAFKGEEFGHVGQSRLFERDGSLTSDPLAWQEREVFYSGTFAGLLANAPQLLRAQLGEVLREQDRIFDHDPLNGYLAKLERRLGGQPDRHVVGLNSGFPTGPGPVAGSKHKPQN